MAALILAMVRSPMMVSPNSRCNSSTSACVCFLLGLLFSSLLRRAGPEDGGRRIAMLLSFCFWYRGVGRKWVTGE